MSTFVSLLVALALAGININPKEVDHNVMVVSICCPTDDWLMQELGLDCAERIVDYYGQDCACFCHEDGFAECVCEED